MNAQNMLAATCIAVMVGVAPVANAAKLVYTTPIFETNGAANGAARMSCNALNLDKKPQNVRAEVVWGNDGTTVVNDKSETVDPGAVKRITFWSNSTNDNFYCRFTVNSNKVRAYANAYDKDFQTLFVIDAK